jgi:hypothetical protein
MTHLAAGTLAWSLHARPWRDHPPLTSIVLRPQQRAGVLDLPSFSLGCTVWAERQLCGPSLPPAAAAPTPGVAPCLGPPYPRLYRHVWAIVWADAQWVGSQQVGLSFSLTLERHRAQLHARTHHRLTRLPLRRAGADPRGRRRRSHDRALHGSQASAPASTEVCSAAGASPGAFANRCLAGRRRADFDAS